MQWGLPWPGSERAAQAESAGAAAFCAGEFSDLNAYVTSSEMTAATTTAMIGPGIAYAFARSPFVHASAVRQLYQRAPGRVFLGLGSGTARMNRDWFGVDATHPAPRMAELVEVIRAFLHAENGAPIRYHGEFYTIDADIKAPCSAGSMCRSSSAPSIASWCAQPEEWQTAYSGTACSPTNGGRKSSPLNYAAALIPPGATRPRCVDGDG
ncbi:luciferase-like monooxygenase family protein [Mycobacterium avium subsp. avium 2285 (R)]|nr:luciferase-like monooxygenase family protein [Mycobacterium avium subsp. avium 2285 (R)]